MSGLPRYTQAQFQALISQLQGMTVDSQPVFEVRAIDYESAPGGTPQGKKGWRLMLLSLDMGGQSATFKMWVERDAPSRIEESERLPHVLIEDKSVIEALLQHCYLCEEQYGDWYKTNLYASSELATCNTARLLRTLPDGRVLLVNGARLEWSKKERTER